MFLLVNGLLTLVFVLLFFVSLWITRRLLDEGAEPDTPRYIDDDDLANSA